MKIIKPLAITDAMLTSSTVAETDYAAWNGATAYVIGDKVIRVSTHRIYERLTNGTTATAPELDSTNWLDISPTNRWAMFDNVVGTSTTVASPLTIVLTPGAVSGIGLLELVGRTVQITMRDAPAGTVVYDRTISLDGSLIGSVFEWFFEEYEQLTSVVLTDLPNHFNSCEVTITITASSGNASCGVCKIGDVINIGSLRSGARVSIIDFSPKTTDTFGNTVIVERAYSKRASFDVVTTPTIFNRIFRRLAELRATPALYIGSENAGYETLVVYGFYKDFSIDVAYQSHHLCTLEVEGLI